ncbi:MAG TPA: cytidylate kinase-like family protein [Clostridiaceae bacterium]|nr:cytidylate kinase-like family protein [Clostridiaceae bacterium]
MPIITVSRQCGSYGDEIAQQLAERLGYAYYERNDILNRFVRPYVTNHVFRMLQESPKFYSEIYEDNQTYYEYLEECIHRMVKNESVVFLGFGARHFFQPEDKALHFRIFASFENRVDRIVSRFKMEKESAAEYVNHWDRKYQRFVSVLFEKDLNQPSHYDGVFNTDSMSPDACIDAIQAVVNDQITRSRLRENKVNDRAEFIMDDIPEMKNQSEIEFARLLNRYQIDWRYEPKSFPVEWDEEGNLITAFRPDFYLPKYDLYLELTTMDQRYVNRKNRKAKMAKEQYGIDVKIVYQRDYRSVMEHIQFDQPDQITMPPKGVIA